MFMFQAGCGGGRDGAAPLAQRRTLRAVHEWATEEWASAVTARTRDWCPAAP